MRSGKGLDTKMGKIWSDSQGTCTYKNALNGMLWELGMGTGRVLWYLVQGSWGGFREEGHLT